METKRKNSIFIRQNDKEILEMQAAAKLYYSLTPKIDTFIYIINAITLLIMIIFESNDWLIITDFVISVILLLLNCFINLYRKNGAKIREYIDGKLYEIECDIREEDVRKLVLKQKKKHQDSIDIYCENTGNDNPRGVKNWYSDYSDKNRVNEILSCQKENLYFDEEIMNKYFYLLIFEFIVILLVGVFLYYKFNFLTSLEMTYDLIIFVSTKIYCVCKQKYDNSNIKSYIAGCEKNLKLENIKHIQKQINKRRKLNIDIPNFIHNNYSNELHNDYNYIINNK